MVKNLVQRWKLRGLIAEWCRFRELVFLMMGGEGVGPRAQERFLATKARIASNLPLVLAMRPSPLRQEQQRQVDLMTSLLNRYRTLSPDASPTVKDREEFEEAWHRHFIFLNTLKGAAIRKNDRAAHPGWGFSTRARARRRGAAFGLLDLLVKVGILASILYLLGRAVGIHWVAGRVVATPPRTADGVGRNVLDGIQSIWGGLVDLMDPVVLTYGQTATIVMVVVLGLGLGYLAFARG